MPTHPGWRAKRRRILPIYLPHWAIQFSPISNFGSPAVIRVTLAALVTIYLLVFLAAVFLVWLSSEWNRRRRERKAFRFRLRCVICGFEFEDRTDALLPRCPRCGSLNERFKFERI